MSENILDIIYVNYNTSDQILASLATLGKAIRKYGYTVTVVDNNSQNDEQLESLRSYPGIKYIQLDKNYGFGYANNRGFEQTSSPLVFFLNPDTLAEKDSIDTMVSYLLNNENVGAVGATLYDAEGNPAHSFRRIHYGIRLEMSNALGHLPLKALYGKSEEHNYTGKPLEVAYVCGAAMMTRRSIIEKTGGFDERFFMYFEDEELNMRISKEGYRIVALDNAPIKHLEGMSINLKEWREKMQNESRRLFYDLSGKSWHRPVMDFFNYFLLTIGEIVGKVRGNTEKVKVYAFRKRLIFN